jgi:hypothetical protein
MVDIKAAVVIITNAFPDDTPLFAIEYNNLYVFRLKRSAPFEEDFDPFCSVDIETGAFSDFSILADGNLEEILTRFETQKVWIA